ncbi:LysE family translocator [Pseudonocardia sp. DSM 110487]|uniref:LysE family translocator n=1 Tax=Pseudonocardia sp. DSM 110487 TaxID=2865833 RepID=UPI001C697461|nr:LysE family translocator [Pseudonocardia sp. DSM 110487]QYN32213.1 LysE family translocator [Pseudonocardia sp. DSM 110487]
MVDPTLFAAFVVAVALLVLTPGPDMLFVMAVGATGGPVVGLCAAAGVAAGLAVHATATAFGLAALFSAVPTLYVVVKICGAGYLLYLGIATLRRRDEPLVRADGAGGGRGRAFRRGLLTNLLNPKVVLFNAAFLPQFVDPARGNVTTQLLVLGAAFVVVDLLVDGPIGLLAGRLGTLLAERRRAVRRLHIATGSIFIGLSARLALTR